MYSLQLMHSSGTPFLSFQSTAQAKLNTSVIASDQNRLDLLTDEVCRMNDHLKVITCPLSRLLGVSRCYFLPAYLYCTMILHWLSTHVGGSSQSWLINATAKPYMEAGMREAPGVIHGLLNEVIAVKYTCMCVSNVFALFLNVAIIHLACIPIVICEIMSHRKSPTGSCALFAIWDVMRYRD